MFHSDGLTSHANCLVSQGGILNEMSNPVFLGEVEGSCGGGGGVCG